MDIYAHAQPDTQSRIQEQETPLPPPERHTNTKFQRWHHFDPATKQWAPTHPTTNTSNDRQNNKSEPFRNVTKSPQDLVLVTWNIDGASPHAQERVTDILTFITGLDPKPSIIFLQEVSKAALRQILSTEHIRTSWLSSEGDDRVWGPEPFTTMTLISKTSIALPGPIWRVSYPSYFDRDALFCDLFLPLPCGQEESISRTRRIRLANVHLDSLAFQPSCRPQQLRILASYLRTVGRGVVAGDFNPVLPEDGSLVEGNGLVDVWMVVRPREDGFTWGTDGKQRYPPRRMDKVVGLGVEGRWMRVLEAGRVRVGGLGGEDELMEGLCPLWSDHHGLVCCFGVNGYRC